MTQTTNWKNVNNWHWVEKNCCHWAKDYLKAKLVGLQNQTVAGKPLVKTTELGSFSGDVDLNQRKGKLITIYDVQLKIDWKGEMEDQTCSGTIELPEFMYDYTPESLEFNVILNNHSTFAEECRQIVLKDIMPQLKERLTHFANDLIAAHSQDVYIPKENMNGHPVTTAYQPKPPVEQAAKMTESVKTIIGGVTTIHQSIEFVCSAQDLYETLTNPQRCMAWTRGTAQFNQDEFSYFGGNITGKWVEKVPCSKLVQQWRLKSWPKDHYSKVTMELKEGSESVTVTLTQTGVPIGEKDTVESNWAHYYWNSIKGVFGYGALL